MTNLKRILFGTPRKGPVEIDPGRVLLVLLCIPALLFVAAIVG